MIRKQDSYAWVLAILCIISLFLFIGEAFFNTRGEPREAVVALSMLQEKNWILPVNNGVELAFKPPLFHWMIAAISFVTGAVTEYTSRMPSALALAVMVFELLWRRITGRPGQGMGDIKALFAVGMINPVVAGISYACAMAALAVAGVALKKEALPLLPFFAAAYALVSMAILFGM